MTVKAGVRTLTAVDVARPKSLPTPSSAFGKYMLLATITGTAFSAIACSGEQTIKDSEKPSIGLEITRERSFYQTKVRFNVTYIMDGAKRIDTSTLKGTEYTFYWFIYQSLGGKDATGQPIEYLLNPMHSDQTQPRYLGVVYRNAILEDGGKGDFLVRVERNPRFSESGTHEWKPVLKSDGTITLKDALYELKSETIEPVRDARLAATMAAFEKDNKSLVRLTKSPTTSVVEYGETTPLVIVKKVE